MQRFTRSGRIDDQSAAGNPRDFNLAQEMKHGENYQMIETNWSPLQKDVSAQRIEFEPSECERLSKPRSTKPPLHASHASAHSKR